MNHCFSKSGGEEPELLGEESKSLTNTGKLRVLLGNEKKEGNDAPILDIEKLTFNDFSDDEYGKIDLKGIEYLDDFFKSKYSSENFSRETIIHLVRLKRFRKTQNIQSNKISEIESKMIEILQNSTNREHNFFAKHIIHLIKEKKLLTLSNKDGLTKLNNRRFAEDMLIEYIKRFKRHGTIFSILLLDVDFFKRINDNFGHNIGDIVLKGLAEILNNNFRGTDIISRWGGEEFLIILDDCNEKFALSKAEKIREKIEEKLATYIKDISPIDLSKLGSNTKKTVEKILTACDNLSCPNREYCGGTKKMCIKEKITCSIGVATCTSIPKNKTSEDIKNELVGFADNALYFAKETRNKVCG